MRRGSEVLVLLSVVAGLTACGVGIRAGADHREGLDLTPYHTFEWGEADDLPTGDPRLDHNPFFLERLHEAIENELAARGVRRVASGADLMVHHHASVRDRVAVYEVDRQAGYDVGRPLEGSEVVQYQEGTFLVDVADAETREILWRGWAQADVEAALDDPSRMRSLVAEAVAQMFEAFPSAP
ncbi:MAG: DUF4136 domain-containing protein [Gemmatimonadetes bacterium]|nr:DUF4136 domain-containing protein [Gemmatimonadota bacterium]